MPHNVSPSVLGNDSINSGTISNRVSSNRKANNWCQVPFPYACNAPAVSDFSVAVTGKSTGNGAIFGQIMSARPKTNKA